MNTNFTEKVLVNLVLTENDQKSFTVARFTMDKSYSVDIVRLLQTTIYLIFVILLTTL